MLRVLVVDDEPPARQRMAQLLHDCAQPYGVEAVGEAGDGPQAIERAAALVPDLVLLDISMPGMDGIAVAHQLARLAHPPAVVFVTAHDEHALQAFDAQAIDYLLKPVRLERLQAALARVARLLGREAHAGPDPSPAGGARSHIPVSERGRLALVPVEDIVYLRAELKYVTIRTAEREFLTEEALTALESEFSGRFVRIHRNALVARDALEGFERVRPRGDGDEEAAAEGHWEVMLRGIPERLIVSRRQWATVKAVLGLRAAGAC